MKLLLILLLSISPLLVIIRADTFEDNDNDFADFEDFEDEEIVEGNPEPSVPNTNTKSSQQARYEVR
jgi:hypothetical protein